jgi:outer membrane lipoprotein-sorting protein
MKLLFVPMLAAVLTQAGDDPAVRLKAMEDTIAKAETAQVGFDAKFEAKGMEGTMKGTLSVGAGNKARVDADVGIMGQTIKIELVSDGTKLVTKAGDFGTMSKDTPKHLRQAMVAVMARTGVATAIVARKDEPDDNVNPLDLIKVSDAKKVKEEKVNGRDALVVSYKLTIKDFPAPITGSVWIDTQTNLPLKRVLRADKDGESFTITETYSNFRINPKLDAGTFKLPN